MSCILFSVVYQLKCASNVGVASVQREREVFFWEAYKQAQCAILAYTNTAENNVRMSECETVRQKYQYLTRSRIDLMYSLVLTLINLENKPAEIILNELLDTIKSLDYSTDILKRAYWTVNKDKKIDIEEVKTKGVNALEEIEDKIRRLNNHQDSVGTFMSKLSYEIELMLKLFEIYTNNHTQEFSLGCEEDNLSYLGKINMIKHYMTRKREDALIVRLNHNLRL